MKTLAGTMILLSGLTLAPPAWAQGVTVQGDVDCGAWLSARKQNAASNLEHFVVGLLNGMTLASQIEFWRADGVLISRDQAYLWLDNYCTKNPLNGVYTGVLSLINERTRGEYSRKIK